MVENHRHVLQYQYSDLDQFQRENLMIVLMSAFNKGPGPTWREHMMVGSWLFQNMSSRSLKYHHHHLHDLLNDVDIPVAGPLRVVLQLHSLRVVPEAPGKFTSSD